MTRIVLAIAIVAALVATSMALNQTQLDALTTIDSVPSKALYESVPSLGIQQTDLQTIASDGSASPAFRLRAIHALSTYCTLTAQGLCPENDPAHLTLVGLLGTNGSAQSGADMLILRGAIEAIGPMRVSTDVTVLDSMLNHPSRDIRATAALSLGALCNTAAINPLHQRYTNESTDQVKLAISAALRMLAACPGS